MIGSDAGQELQKPFLIVRAGRTFPTISRNLGDFDDWIAAGLGNPTNQRRLEAQAMPPLPAPETLTGVVVSGSHSMVTDREVWSERLAAWLRRCVDAEVPVLGICYGHQLLAHAMGGKVGYRSAGVEIGTHVVSRTADAADDVLFQAVPEQFAAHLVHAQSVLALPPGATLLAHSAMEPHQAFRIGRCAWGVQFHPEFSSQVMRDYIRCKAEDPKGEALETETLLQSVQETPDASALLARFADAAISRYRSWRKSGRADHPHETPR